MYQKDQPPIFVTGLSHAAFDISVARYVVLKDYMFVVYICTLLFMYDASVIVNYYFRQNI